jgi:signal transduction histidine kinase
VTTKAAAARRLTRRAIYAIVLLPFGAAAGYSYFKIERVLNEAALARRGAFATLVATVLNEKFEHLADIGSALATRVRFGELVERGRWREAMQLLAAVPKTFPFIDRVFVTDGKGTLMADVPALPGAIGKNFAYRDWYREVKASGRPSISEVYRRWAHPQYEMIALSVPIAVQNDPMRGVLVLQIRSSTLLQWLGEIPAEQGGNVEIIDRKGRIAASQRSLGEGGSSPGDRDGAVAAEVPRYGWKVVAWQTGALSARNKALRILLAVYGLLLLMTLTLARVLARALENLQANEAELARARDAALETARFKSEFAANISHEIRTPMNAILGITELLLESPLTGAQREDLRTVRTAGELLLALINDVLDLSKLEAGKMTSEALDFDLRGAMANVVSILEGAARAKGLRIVCSVSWDVPAILRGDMRHLQQILTNLLSNAVKFTERGDILLQAEKERESESDVWIRFQVADTGIGIPPEERARLFEAFVQADSATTRKYGGTGLGLSISKLIAEMMGGEIGVDSVAGRGSTFWLRLKFQKSPGSRDPAP